MNQSNQHVILKDAYLIVIYDEVTNAVIRADIWSSPEWEQSRCLTERTYVAYRTKGRSFEDARKNVIQAMSHKLSRYHWLLEYLDDEKYGHIKEAHEC